ncbi:tRNA (adenosine(37)-N6)-threonylcarbamoyltransferase complex ATPase subunit type 1 TsaE [Ehrlichia ruminantium]|uniref:tRNA threonylcarbamoyladenosine biosynthesis protein TsaE n=1 Tax=Ehrlichia ruminantium TaxID=779 RepID=A0AAE6Q9L4_EHRRU|nr:tRNA (adenosine(37)-N6)-threonylcarbamoyltransferase complex ATPase subunit type 1 TsaE [Ehrlichia ruminantium]QGR02954.1 tRNA (adenosine(37)-N6)-threonylcarbamoyltransferase complex ATPase subunit type 1 TsaE [Ehrlichia ruminantium]QGR03879.1 tRNA (adenosine(37)-N6)-threonylcarbamoyltransferase complex ATPase subunit type 1 TsaE [Ehrlichia ruminantium]QGR04804.1 tRNA (adenosine(37)-N6)-threonylcarbamoyltransferase complex ATPase subunit type 1 TsaE [Ehrlichia ruminantium]
MFSYNLVDFFYLKKLARLIAFNLRSSDSISLTGDLGVGKTSFVKLLVNELVPFEDVSSPTFNIIHEYHFSKFVIYHIDLYRVNFLHEIYDMGIDTICDSGVAIVEWPSLLNDILNFNLKVDIQYSVRENLRDISIVTDDDFWYDILKCV